MSKRKLRAKTLVGVPRVLPKLGVGDAALYRVDGMSVDVTDLLNIDFEILELLEDALIHLSTRATDLDDAARCSYLIAAVTTVLDRQIDRVLKLSDRLATEHGYCISNPRAWGTSVGVAEQCDRVNRLRDRAQKSDYVTLRTHGRDAFSKMSCTQLAHVVSATTWMEIQVRLRAHGLLTPTNVAQAARWAARGLEVRHVIQKIRFDRARAGLPTR